MFTVVACLSMLAVKPLSVALPKGGSVSAALVDDVLFVDVRESIAVGYSPSRIEARFNQVGLPPSSSVAITHRSGASQLAKVEYRDSILMLFNEFAFPHEAIPFLDGTAFAERAIELTFGKGTSQNTLENRYKIRALDLLFPNHRKPDYEPPSEQISKSVYPDPVYQARSDYILHPARYHFTLLSQGTVKLFHAVSGRLHVSDELAGLEWQTKLPKPPSRPDRNLRTGLLPKEFRDSRFTVYRDRHYYLVTDKGTVFLVEPEGKDKVVVRVVWNDPKRWVFGVYSDNDGAVYGFGYDGPFRDLNRFHVRFDPKPVAVSYKFTQKLTGNADKDGLAEAYECGRAIWKAKQPPPKEKK